MPTWMHILAVVLCAHAYMSAYPLAERFLLKEKNIQRYNIWMRILGVGVVKSIFVGIWMGVLVVYTNNTYVNIYTVIAHIICMGFIWGAFTEAEKVGKTVERKS